MNLFALGIMVILFIVVIFLCSFLWVGGVKFFQVVSKMKDDISSINMNLSTLLLKNEKEHEKFNQRLEIIDRRLDRQSSKIAEHEKILNADLQ